LLDFLVQSKYLQEDDKEIPFGFIFPTRPFTLAEVTSSCQSVVLKPELLAIWMKAIRGIRCGGGVGTFECKNSPNLTPVNINYEIDSNIRTIAVPCLLTEESSWKASVTQAKDPVAGDRYFRINGLINAIL
jgi:hypothetical protein